MTEQLELTGVDPLGDAVSWKRRNPEAYRALVLWAKEDVANGVRPSMDAYGHLLRRPHMAARLSPAVRGRPGLSPGVVARSARGPRARRRSAASRPRPR